MGLRTMKKRRKQGKTDYKLRLGLLKSGVARVVIRRTNRYITVQLVESDEAKDKVIEGVNSKDLIKNGVKKLHFFTRKMVFIQKKLHVSRRNQTL